MNTAVWGPPMWRILHELAWLYDRVHAPSSGKRIQSILEALRTTLPCKYCRDSFTEFYKILGGSVTDHLRTRTMTAWMHELHNLVNAKLLSQQCASAITKWRPACNEALFDVLSHPLPLATLRKRLQVQRPYCSIEDVLLGAAVFLVNTQSGKSDPGEVAALWSTIVKMLYGLDVVLPADVVGALSALYSAFGVRRDAAETIALIREHVAAKFR